MSSGGSTREDAPRSRRPHVLVAAGQTEEVRHFCRHLQQSDYRVDAVAGSGAAVARILREENRHPLLVTVGQGTDQPPPRSRLRI